MHPYDRRHMQRLQHEIDDAYAALNALLVAPRAPEAMVAAAQAEVFEAEQAQREFQDAVDEELEMERAERRQQLDDEPIDYDEQDRMAAMSERLEHGPWGAP